MKVSWIVRNGSLLLLVFFLFGCNRSSTNPSTSQKLISATEAALEIRRTESPTDGDSREPELNATHDGRIILSWVEKTGDKRYALRMATRDLRQWSESLTVAEGENWFVNWADFPSVIALQDGSLAAHWLVKSGSGTYAYT
jgi:hypothetical protein